MDVEETGISLENTLWANCVISAGNAVGVVVYSGRETRSVMNNSMPRSKVGLIDLEINDLTKVVIFSLVFTRCDSAHTDLRCLRFCLWLLLDWRF